VIEFYASLPDIQSAISISGNGQGARVKLDIPETEVEAAVALSRLGGKLLRVRVEVEDEEGYDSGDVPMGTGSADGDPEWARKVREGKIRVSM